MARPQKPILRDRQLNLSLTLDEYAALRRRAETVGERPSSYARAVLMTAAGTIGTTVADARFDRLAWQQLARIGANLNQLVRRFHMTGLVSPDALAGTLAEIRELLRERPP